MSADGLIVVITGGTRFENVRFVWESLDRFHASRPIAEMVNGMAPEGVDYFCYLWAERNGIITRQFPANWEDDPKGAGVKRNQEMIDENPDIDLALIFPGHRGTIDMTRRLRKANIERVFFDPPGSSNLAAWG